MAGRGGVEIDGRHFTKSLAKKLDALEDDGEKDLLRLGVDIQKRARLYAPVGEGPGRARVSKRTGKTVRRRPGNLRRKIKVTARRDRQGIYTVTTRSSAFYGRFLEYGTRNMRPKPFFRQAVTESVNQFKRRPARLR